VTPDGLKNLHGKRLEAFVAMSRSHSGSHCDFSQFNPEKELAMGNLSITYVDISSIKPYARNARNHPRKQVNLIAAAMQEFGIH